VATVATGTHPQDVSLAPDGRHGYVVAVDADTVQVFDTAAFRETATVPTGNSPTSVAVAPDGRRAYVTNLKDGTLTVLDTVD
jgi:YVTN family beta-propeller protein